MVKIRRAKGKADGKSYYENQYLLNASATKTVTLPFTPFVILLILTDTIPRTVYTVSEYCELINSSAFYYVDLYGRLQGIVLGGTSGSRLSINDKTISFYNNFSNQCMYTLYAIGDV